VLFLRLDSQAAWLLALVFGSFIAGSPLLIGSHLFTLHCAVSRDRRTKAVTQIAAPVSVLGLMVWDRGLVPG